MKKIVLAGLVLAGSLFAQEQNSNTPNMYIGFGTTSGSGTQTRDYNTGNSFETEYDTSSNVYKIGWILSSKNRVELSIDNVEAERTGGNPFVANTNSSDTTSEFKGYNIDFLFTLGNSDTILPYIDLGFGSYKNDEIRGLNSSGNMESASAISLNLGVGTFVSLTENFELEAAYKMKRMNWNLDNPDVTENFKYVYLGANLKF